MTFLKCAQGGKGETACLEILSVGEGKAVPSMKYDSMDEPNSNNDAYTNGTFEINQVVNISSNVKKKVARRRWAILAKALKSPTGSEPSSPTDEFSVRRISSFMLLTTRQLENVKLKMQDNNTINQAKSRLWYQYAMLTEKAQLFVIVAHRIRTFSAEDLMGFNNTGNICIWPSEETLTFHIGCNLDLLKNKTVLELGGGMSCLAGLFSGKYGGASHVTLTDGNKMSVENVQISLSCNEFTCPVDCLVLKWGQDKLNYVYDVILCADCLFFDDARSDLIETLWDSLAVNGVALIMAPKRGNTLNAFMKQCECKGFKCKEIVKYNNIVWEKHLELAKNCDYDANIHYPILIELTKV